jgi:DNA-binding CsgD family transcriptional regulator
MSNLTKREAQIVALIAEGKPTAQIAAELRVTVFTVQKHRSNISRKFDLHTSAQLVSFCVSRSPDASTPAPHSTMLSLTSREVGILRELSRGRTSKEIGKILCISHRTVSKHIENIRKKISPNTLASLIRIANTISKPDLDD